MKPHYYFDTERDGHADTVRMFEAIGRGEYEGFTSRYVTYELEQSPEPKQSNMLALIDKYHITVLEPDEEAARLDMYISKRVLSPQNTNLTAPILLALRSMGLIVCFLSISGISID